MGDLPTCFTLVRINQLEIKSIISRYGPIQRVGHFADLVFTQRTIPIFLLIRQTGITDLFDMFIALRCVAPITYDTIKNQEVRFDVLKLTGGEETQTWPSLHDGQSAWTSRMPHVPEHDHHL